ncbi:hypothetical protein E4T56_gene5794, partial [Termitomyces sp. T112]
LFSGKPGPPDLLRPARARFRARDQEAAGVLGEVAPLWFEHDLFGKRLHPVPDHALGLTTHHADAAGGSDRSLPPVHFEGRRYRRQIEARADNVRGFAETRLGSEMP